jgi:putative tryptophan/tyrosine transport system substrate-binding protein
MMNRRRFLQTVSASLLAAPLVVEAQQAGKMHRIGYLSWLGCSSDPFVRGPFREGLRELGYVEGHNIAIECRSATGTPDRYPELVTELVRLNVNVLVAVGTDLALAAKRMTTRVPIIILYISDPVASGLVSTLARPGANVTGLSMLGSEMSQKGLEILKEIAPTVSRVTVLLDSRNPGQVVPYQQLAAAAKVLGVSTQHVDIRSSADLDAAFAAVLNQRAHALFVYPLPITPRAAQRLAEFAVMNRLPAATPHDPYVRAGLLLSYVTDMPRQFRRAGVYIDRILRGAQPADLPVEQADKFELSINLKTVKALGLTIPPSLLLRADHVIE